MKKIHRQIEIKSAALALFAKHGYHGTSTEMIIAKAGVSKGLLFFHFKNKQELLTTLLYEWMEQLWKEIVPTTIEKKKAIDCLEELMDNILVSLVKYEAQYRLHYSLLLIEHPISSKAELKKLKGYTKLQEYLHWLFNRLKVKDVEGEVKLFSATMLGAEMNFLILIKGQRANFELLKSVLIQRYTALR
jgi:AcrR family transcriptional regulator